MGSPGLLLPYLALGAVCIFWGTTYLGIRVALESFPPLVLMALRFIISGSILLVWARAEGVAFPTPRETLRTAAVGLMLLGVANSCLTYSETLIPSGLAALFLTTAPFWLVGIEAITGGEKLTLPIAIGLAIGLCGTAILVFPGAGALEITAAIWAGFLILQLGSFFWNAGSILQRRWRTGTHFILTGAIQQMAVGLVCLLLALVTPQREIHWSSLKGWAGIAWLVTFGSIVAYSAYIYALNTLPISLVSIYTYVNPIVAVSLGKLFYDEPFGAKETLAMLVIFVGVGIVKRYSHRPA